MTLPKYSSPGWQLCCGTHNEVFAQKRNITKSPSCMLECFALPENSVCDVAVCVWSCHFSFSMLDDNYHPQDGNLLPLFYRCIPDLKKLRRTSRVVLIIFHCTERCARVCVGGVWARGRNVACGGGSKKSLCLCLLFDIIALQRLFTHQCMDRFAPLGCLRIFIDLRIPGFCKNNKQLPSCNGDLKCA